MKIKTKIITVIALILIVSSCSVISFYPLYTKDVLITNNDIVGTWASVGLVESKDTLIWEIRRPNNKEMKTFLKKEELYNIKKYPYILSLSSKHSLSKQKTEFALHLIEIEGKNYIDFYLKSCDLSSSDLGLPFQLIAVHTFAKINISKNKIIIDWFDSDWLSGNLKNKKIRIKHENSDENTLLTAQPKELQKFVAKYANDKNAFSRYLKLALKPVK